MRTLHFLVAPAARVSILALVSVLLLGLAACSPPDSGNQPGTTATGGTDGDATDGAPGATTGDDGGAGQTHTVNLAGFAFDPQTLEIAVGDTVQFVNEDDAPHTATHGEDGQPADDAAFDIDLAESGAEGEFTFEEAGTYTVTCKIHPEMNMTIEVTEG